MGQVSIKNIKTYELKKQDVLLNYDLLGTLFIPNNYNISFI